MKLTIEKNENVLTVAVSGKVDTITAVEFEKAIEDHLDGVTELILDLKEMTYTSSAGLRVILKAQKAMNKQGTMKVVNVRPDVMDIFEITGFTDILTIE